jgi:ABC-type antimicrobial peptide transport system permease subunit
VAIVNEAFVERFWPGESAIGKTIDVAIDGWVDPTIVGVASTAKIRGLGEAPRPFIYLPYAQETNAWTTVIARTQGDPQATARDLYRLLRERYPDAIISENTTLAEHIGVMLIARRLSAVLSTVFAVVALTLAIIGLYGVVSYAVSRRAREVGIRMSLGAEPTSVVRMMVGGGMRLVAYGGVFGLLAALAASRVLSGFLYGVTPFDPITLITVPGILLGVAFLAAYLPARRASRVDPVRSLKSE